MMYLSSNKELVITTNRSKLLLLCLSFIVLQQTHAAPVNHGHGGRQHSHPLHEIGVTHRHGNGASGKLISRTPAENAKAKKHGYFSGSVAFEQLADGRKKRLVNTVIFTDPSGKKWKAPKGHVVDGASIPKLLWPIIGSPFTGKYLAASVIHDVACDEKKESWEAVHKVFHHAMLASGVSETKANLMYRAVYLSGPRWGEGADKRLTEKEFKLLIPESITDLLDSSKRHSYTSFFDNTRQWWVE